MTNQDRQKALENERFKKLGEYGCETELYCAFCEHEKINPCAKAFNRMMRNKAGTSERQKFMWGDF